MIFEMLRAYRVDIMRYLPSYLKKDDEFLNAQDTLSWEHEQYRLKLIDIMNQFFIDTVTWGIDDWERVYNVTPRDVDTIRVRRERVKQKMKGASTITVAVMNDLINSVLPNKDARFIDNIDDGVFRIEMETATALQEVRAIVNMYKPAHLDYLITQIFKFDTTWGFGGCIHIVTKTVIPVAKSEDVATTTTTIGFGGSVRIYNNFHI